MHDIATLVDVGTVAFLVLVVLSLLRMRQRPATPPFARRAPTGSARQLRADGNARIFYDRGGFLFRKRWFFTATGCPPARLLKFNDQDYVRWQRAQANQPVKITSHGPRTWWWFDGEFYWDSAGHNADDVRALVRDRQRREQARLDRAHMLLRADEQQSNDTRTETRQRRGPIPRELARAVYERDGGQCVQCGARFDLQYDHIIPVALGGATTLENLQLLCGDCNRTKGANI